VKKGTAPAVFGKAIENGKVEEYLHAIDVAPGDAIFLPSGRLHALGSGNLLVEIQENSDTTYRVFDWNRVKKGRARREMHIAQAMQCIDFGDIEPALLRPAGESLIGNELFEIDKWTVAAERQIAEPGRFAIVVCLTGELTYAGRQFKPGDFFLVPAELEDRAVRPLSENASLLRVMLPR
jgi:mannose-6-phosphate isomerase